MLEFIGTTTEMIVLFPFSFRNWRHVHNKIEFLTRCSILTCFTQVSVEICFFSDSLFSSSAMVNMTLVFISLANGTDQRTGGENMTASQQPLLTYNTDMRVEIRTKGESIILKYLTYAKLFLVPNMKHTLLFSAHTQYLRTRRTPTCLCPHRRSGVLQLIRMLRRGNIRHPCQ